MIAVAEATRVLEELRRGELLPPRSLTVSITRACNLACAHCWVESPADTPSVSPENLRGVVDDFCALGGRELCLTGGEPLLHPHWAEIFRAACGDSRLSMVRIQTNGTLLDAEAVAVLQTLEPSTFGLQVSLEGATAPAHDRVRGDGAFRRVRQGLERLAAAGLAGRTTVAFTEMRHNLAELPAVLDWAEHLGLAAVTSAPVVRCGRAGASDRLEAPTPEQYRELLERYRGDGRFQALADRLGRVAALAWLRGLGRTREEGCTFVENPYLTADGTLYPCVLFHCDAYAGQEAFSRGLCACLLGAVPRLVEARRVSLRRVAGLPECAECSCRCWCGGGCMGRAWAAHAELLGAEDRCALRRAVQSLGGGADSADRT
jgi:radical SAM protein with 4Fe4S-binding SPASM domain